MGENDYGLKKAMIVTCNPYFNCTTAIPAAGAQELPYTNQTMGPSAGRRFFRVRRNAP